MNDIYGYLVLGFQKCVLCCSLQDPPLPLDLKGKNFVKLFGTRTRYCHSSLIFHLSCILFLISRSNIQSLIISAQIYWIQRNIGISDLGLDLLVVDWVGSAMELLLIKRKMKGPCWLSIDNPRRCTGSSQVSSFYSSSHMSMIGTTWACSCEAAQARQLSLEVYRS